MTEQRPTYQYHRTIYRHEKEKQVTFFVNLDSHGFWIHYSYSDQSEIICLLPYSLRVALYTCICIRAAKSND